MRSIDKFIEILFNYESRNAIFEGLKIYRYSDLSNRILIYNKKLESLDIKPGGVVFILGDYSIETIALFLFWP